MVKCLFKYKDENFVGTEGADGKKSVFIEFFEVR